VVALTRRKYLIGGTGFLVFAGLGLWALFLSEQKATSVIGKPFMLTDADGRAFDFKELQGKPSLIYFGFTHCPDICPTTLFLLAQVMKKLETRKNPSRKSRLDDSVTTTQQFGARTPSWIRSHCSA